MPLAVRYTNDTLEIPNPPAGFTVRNIVDSEFMAHLQARHVDDIAQRYAAGHKAYVAFINNETAAWGWVATRTAEIGELGSTFSIGTRDRYLWNFVTLAPFRGRGIYPCLIEAIVRAESRTADRFWIAYAPENHASGAGIRKAGFQAVAELSFDSLKRPRVHAIKENGGALAASVLGIPEATETLTECWRCVRAGRTAHFCRPGECRCDYQKQDIPCHTN